MPTTYYSARDTIRLASEAVSEADKSLRQLGDELDVSHAAIQRATDTTCDSPTRYIKLASRIIEHVYGDRVEGPYWAIADSAANVKRG